MTLAVILPALSEVEVSLSKACPREGGGTSRITAKRMISRRSRSAEGSFDTPGFYNPGGSRRQSIELITIFMQKNDPSMAPSPFVYCRGERFRKYLDEGTIQERVRALAGEIDAMYAGKRPIFIAVLNGAFMFFSDLLKAITIECEVDFMKLSSYGDAKVSSGNVSELKRIDATIEGRHVIVVEDIVDTGLSMAYILERMAEHGPASLRTAVLLHKEEATRVDVQLDFVAFRIPNLFVLGYGLDFGQLGRNLPAIYLLDPPVEGA